MDRARVFSTGIGVALVIAGALAQADIVLVDRGQAQATIVTADSPSTQAAEAAEILQSYLERISGARLEIRKEGESVGGSRIFVGQSQAVRDLGIEVPFGFTNAMNEEGFVIKTVGNDLVLAGNEDWHYRGTVYAVYDFLESLGCRWFFPGKFGEVVPKLDSIWVEPVDRVERPDFRFRNVWYSGWMPVSEQNGKDMSEWMSRNKLNTLAGLSLPGDGSIVRLAPAEKYFESHPHIYAVDEKGERMRDMLCLTEPEAVSIAVQTIKEEFRENPEAITFGFAPPDGHPMCHCDRCRAEIPGFAGKGYGDPSLSDVWFRFVNEVATEIYKEFPDRWLFTNGYANRVRPPEGIGPLCPNLGIQSAVIGACTLHPIGAANCFQRQDYKTILDRWTEELNGVFIYDYDPGKALDGMPFPMLHNLERDFPYFKERNVWGFWTEGQNSWMVTHLNYYIRGRLMWNARADVRALVKDYCERFYGPAAAPVERYIWTLEDAVANSPAHASWGWMVCWTRVLPLDIVRELDALIAEAESSGAEGDAALHVRVLDLVHRHMRAYLEMEWAAGRGNFAEAVQYVDRIEALRDEAATVDPALLPHLPDWCRGSSGTPYWHRELYQGLADQAGGAKGELIALLPQYWEFKTDPEDLGVIYQWYRPGVLGPWDRLDTTAYWELQGYQDERGWGYVGKAWYRTGVFVPQDAAGKPIRLTLAGVFNRGVWTWVNGQLADHRPRQDSSRPFDFDVTNHIRPGEMNYFAVLVDNTTSDHRHHGGLYRRCFLWQPKE